MVEEPSQVWKTAEFLQRPANCAFQDKLFGSAAQVRTPFRPGLFQACLRLISRWFALFRS